MGSDYIYSDLLKQNNRKLFLVHRIHKKPDSILRNIWISINGQLFFISQEKMTIKNNELNLLERIAGFAGAYIVPKELTKPTAILNYWYQTNGYHKYQPGDCIKLKKRKFFYGNQFPWTVKDYKDDGNYFVIDSRGKRTMEYKWNIEHDFKKVDSIENRT